MSRTLLDNAFSNLNMAKDILYRDISDEMFLNFAAYHLQQAVEMAVKYQMEQEGIHYNYTHSIESLLQCLRKNEVEPIVTEYVDDHSEMLSVWGSNTRYNLDYLAEERKLTACLPEVEKSLEQCKKRYEVLCFEEDSNEFLDRD